MENQSTTATKQTKRDDCLKLVNLTKRALPPQPVTVAVFAKKGPSKLPEMFTSPALEPDADTVTLIQSSSPNDVAAEPATTEGKTIAGLLLYMSTKRRRQVQKGLDAAYSQTASQRPPRLWLGVFICVIERQEKLRCRNVDFERCLIVSLVAGWDNKRVLGRDRLSSPSPTPVSRIA